MQKNQYQPRPKVALFPWIKPEKENLFYFVNVSLDEFLISIPRDVAPFISDFYEEGEVRFGDRFLEFIFVLDDPPCLMDLENRLKILRSSDFLVWVFGPYELLKSLHTKNPDSYFHEIKKVDGLFKIAFDFSEEAFRPRPILKEIGYDSIVSLQ